LDITQQQIELHKMLTPREREYLTHFCHSLNQKEIAFEMNVSPQTVATYKTSIMRKLNITTKLELVAYAVRLGLAA
jgi:DNA-binding NarL/FixJ family response regulator